jgi:hypothetical protein
MLSGANVPNQIVKSLLICAGESAFERRLPPKLAAPQNQADFHGWNVGHRPVDTRAPFRRSSACEGRMKDMIRFLGVASLSLAVALAGETAVKMKDLPPAVQKAVEQQTKGAQIMGLSKEVEKGKTMYEVETTLNGKGRDLLFDATGALVSVEEPVAIDAIPAAARAAIEKLAVGGKIKSVESVTKGQTVTYEAVVAKGLKKSEVVVAADGSIQK